MSDSAGHDATKENVILLITHLENDKIILQIVYKNV
jgi:hypothetical protein